MAVLKLKEIRDYIRNKTDEDTTYFTDEILNSFINNILDNICEDTLIYERIAKSLIEYPTDGIYLPDDFIDVIEFYVNNIRYTKISFGDLKNYVGENAEYPSDYIYYVRNNKLIVLSNQKEVLEKTSLKKGDELTLYYYSYFPKLVNDEDSIQAEFHRGDFLDLIANGVIAQMKEKDEIYDTAQYYLQKFEYGKQKLKKRNKFKNLGKVKFRRLKEFNKWRDVFVDK